MIQLFFKRVWRRILKNGAFTAINFAGLSVGITIFLLLMLFVLPELNYDKHYDKKDRIYRLEYADGDQWMHSGDGHLMYNSIPEVEKYTRFTYFGETMLGYRSNSLADEINIEIEYLALADSFVCDIFGLKFIEGDPLNALNQPFSIVLTKSTAEKLFGNEYAYNKIINVGNGKRKYTVKGVIEDLQEPTHLNFQAIASFVTLEKLRPKNQNTLNNFESQQYATYVLLTRNHNKKGIVKKMDKLVLGNVSRYQTWKAPIFQLRELEDVYLNGDPVYGDKSNNGKFIYTLLFIAILILVVAIINYINLSLSSSLNTFTEVGINKIIGARSKTITFQVISESLLFNLVAFIFALILTYLLIPFFNNIFESSIELNILFKPIYLLLSIIGIVIIGIISGLYPAILFNRISPVNTLKNNLEKGSRKFQFRHGLTVFQFCISIALIISTIVITKQMILIRDKNLGFNNEQVLTSSTQNINRESFKYELLKNPNIETVSFSNTIPGQVNNWEITTFNDISRGIPIYSVDPDFLDMYGLKIVQGRNFDNNTRSDIGNTCLLNEAAVKYFNLDNPIGATCDFSHSNYTSFSKGLVQVIGVVNDFNFRSLHRELGPMAINWNGWGNVASIKLSSHNMNETIDYIKSEWEKRTDYEFTFEFADESFYRQYKSEEKFSKMMNLAALIAILISSLGILGLAVFSIKKRIKEIGIRKVNGAKVSEILTMLNTDLVRWVIIAFVVACPVAYYAMNKWLENFAYKTELSWWIFALAGILALGIALLTVSWQSWKAATRNPVEALRYE
jgi:putative ABC transport system permease protein